MSLGRPTLAQPSRHPSGTTLLGFRVCGGGGNVKYHYRGIYGVYTGIIMRIHNLVYRAQYSRLRAEMSGLRYFSQVEGLEYTLERSNTRPPGTARLLNFLGG